MKSEVQHQTRDTDTPGIMHGLGCDAEENREGEPEGD